MPDDEVTREELIAMDKTGRYTPSEPQAGQQRCRGFDDTWAPCRLPMGHENGCKRFDLHDEDSRRGRFSMNETPQRPKMFAHEWERPVWDTDGQPMNEEAQYIEDMELYAQSLELVVDFGGSSHDGTSKRLV